MIYDHYCFKYRARDCFGCLIVSSGSPKVSRITLLGFANRDLGPPRSTHTCTSQLQIFPKKEHQSAQCLEYERSA